MQPSPPLIPAKREASTDAQKGRGETSPLRAFRFREAERYAGLTTRG
jgi:hypothetical protein